MMLIIMFRAMFGLSAQGILSFPPHPWAWRTRQLTEVSEALSALAFDLNGIDIFLRLIAKRSQKERWLVTISISPTSGYKP